MSLITLPTTIIYPGLGTNTGGALAIASQGGYNNLDAAEEMFGVVIRAPLTGTINKVGYCLSTATTPNLTLDVGLETVLDAVLAPVATTVAGRTLLGANSYGQEVFTGSLTGTLRVVALTTPVAVTKDDLMTLTVRCSSYTSGLVRGLLGHAYMAAGEGGNFPYGFWYLNSAFSGMGGSFSPHLVALEYATYGFVPIVGSAGFAYIGAESFQQSTNPDHRGCKFSLDFKCRVVGIIIPLDADVDTTFELYDADEYTVLQTQTIDKDKRAGTGGGSQIVTLTSAWTPTPGSVYRWSCYPATAGTNISLQAFTSLDDEAFNSMTTLPQGTAWCKSTFEGSPSAGSHTWTDDDNIRYPFGLIIDQLDDGVASVNLDKMGAM